MEYNKSSIQFHIALGVALLVAALFLTPNANLQVNAQTVPSGCLANGPECSRTASGPNCPAAYVGKRCNQVPCAYRGVNFCNCGSCLNSCDPVCRTTTSPTITPFVTQPTTDTNVTPTNSPLSAECAQRCDLDGNGVINKEDWRSKLENGGMDDPAVVNEFNFCANSCPWEGGNNPGPLPVPSTSPSKGVLGDCTGDTPGQPDGAVDLRDFEYYRSEHNNEVTTLACDFDNSGDVDIIDFANYLRPGYIQYNGGGNPQPSNVPDDGSVTPVSPNGSI